jgi:hypothetical protein
MLHLQSALTTNISNLQIQANTIWALAHKTLGGSEGQAYFAKSMPWLGILTSLMTKWCQYDITFEVKNKH